jgi:gliding motility-associated-like protein
MKNCFCKAAFCFLGMVFFIDAVQAQITAVVTTQPTTCDHNNGSAVVTPSGGSGYTYQWSYGSSATNAESGFPAGNYTVTVTSTTPAATTVEPFTIGASTGVSAQFVRDSMPTCGKNNGSITCSTTSTNSLNSFYRNDTLAGQGGGTYLAEAGPGNYTFITLDNSTGCTDTVFNILLTDNSTTPVFANVQVTPDLCYGSNSGRIAVTVSNCGGGCTFNWSNNAADHTDSATGLPAGIDTFFVTGGSCTNLDTAIYVPGPQAALTAMLTVHPDHCGNNVGTAMDSTTGGTPPYTYVWSMGAPTASGDSVNQLAGDSTVRVTVTDSHGCSLTDSGYIGRTPGPSATLTQSDTICASESDGVLIVNPTTAGTFTFQWSNGATTNVDAALSPGTYTVTVADNVGCDTVLTGVVPAYTPYFNILASPSNTVTQGETVVLQVQTNVPVKNIVWDPYITGSTGNTEVAFVPQQTVAYYVVITYGQSCQISDSIIVNIDTSSASARFAIPNTFTPNGDGNNDLFTLISYPEVSVFHIWVYDRWGNKVYESTDVNFGWNGLDQYAGNKALNSGVYAYVIQYQTYTSNDKQVIGGNISLVR